jgi:hypothetical protein
MKPQPRPIKHPATLLNTLPQFAPPIPLHTITTITRRLRRKLTR